MQAEVETNKQKFLDMYSQIAREGNSELLAWLEKTDFFTAPASTRFHGSFEGGLCLHSINVANQLIGLVSHLGLEDNFSQETLLICGLLHDLCKTNFYKTDMRNTKDESGNWVKVPYYTIEDKFPYGHGEKSVYMITSFMKLTGEEAIAIRWHMGGFDNAVQGGTYSMSNAYDKYTLPVLLHTADMLASYVDEK